MSGTRQLTAPGMAITDEDGQRGFDAAADADDLALAALITANPDVYFGTAGTTPTRVVIPSPRRGSGTMVIPEQILEAATGPDAGKIKLYQALFAVFADVAGSVDATNGKGHIELLHRLDDAMLTALLPTNTAFAPTTYLLYATIQRTTSVSASRKQKNLTTQVVSTSTIPVATEPTITLSILQNATLVDVPADGPDSFNIALAEIDIPHPYVSGTAITQSWIRPLWRRGGVSPNAVQQVQVVVPTASGVLDTYSAGYAANYRGQRQATKRTVQFLVKLNGGTGYFKLWESIDLRSRLLRTSIILPINHAETVDAITTGGADLSVDAGLRFSGTAGGAMASFDGGKILLHVGTGAGSTPTAGAFYLQTVAPGAGCYLIELEYGDRLDI